MDDIIRNDNDRYRKLLEDVRKKWKQKYKSPKKRNKLIGDLKKKILSYERKYFEDFTLKDEFIRRKLTYGWDNGIPTLSLEDWEINPEVDPWSLDIRASCNSVDRVFSFDMAKFDSMDEDELMGTMLHEMIHAYEEQIPKICETDYYGINLEQFFISYLTQNLVEKRGEDFKHTFDVISDNRFYVVEQDHSLLFILKSLELDIQLDKELGTIFGVDPSLDHRRLELLGWTDPDQIESSLQEFWEDPDNM